MAKYRVRSPKGYRGFKGIAKARAFAKKQATAQPKYGSVPILKDEYPGDFRVVEYVNPGRLNPRSRKYIGINRKIRRAAKSGGGAKEAYARKRAYARMVKALGNPRKLRKVTKTTGWIKADAVRFVKKRGKPIEVLVRRQPAKRRRK